MSSLTTRRPRGRLLMDPIFFDCNGCHTDFTRSISIIRFSSTEVRLLNEPDL